MTMEVDKIETGNPVYDELENLDNVTGYEQISPDDVDQYDLVVSVEGTKYGVNVSTGLAKVENELGNYENVKTMRTRSRRGSASAGILDPNTSTMTVEEAATALDSRDPEEVATPGSTMEPQETDIEDSVTASRYGKRKVTGEANW